MDIWEGPSFGFLLRMLLYLWLMLLLVVGWITATHFSGVSPTVADPGGVEFSDLVQKLHILFGRVDIVAALVLGP